MASQKPASRKKLSSCVSPSPDEIKNMKIIGNLKRILRECNTVDKLRRFINHNTKNLKLPVAGTLKMCPETGSDIPLVASGMDDALDAGLFKLKIIADGSLPMPFCHVWFFAILLRHLKNTKYNNADRDIYNTLEELINKLEIVNKLSIIRNRRLMEKITSIIKTDPDRFKTFKPFMCLSDDKYNLDIAEVLLEAFNNNISPWAYLNENTDQADIDSCMNDFCLDQTGSGVGKAVDNVGVCIDKYGEFWAILIQRAQGPGKTFSVAHAGGFADIKPSGKIETLIQTARRERKEELKTNIDKVYTKTLQLIIQEELYLPWDIRACFWNGMKVGALAIFYYN